jgi:pentatricopeptide repeat protein
MFSSCGSLEDAAEIFDTMSRCGNNNEGFSAMISGYLANDDLEMALHLFRRMQEQALHPDAIACIGLLKACSGLGALEQGRQIHACMEKLGLALVDPWHHHHHHHHHHRIALANMYARCGSLADADTALQNAQPSDSTTWSTILAPCIPGYVLCTSDTAIEAAIKRMQEEEEAASTMDGIAYLCSLLKACSSSSDAHRGLLIHAQIQKLGLASDPDIQDALLDMHAKCGNVECACDALDTAEHSSKDVRSWTMILACFAEHGLVDMVARYLRAMHGIDILPDSPFFLCILCACNHSGLLEEALHCLASTVEKTSSDRIVAVEHYICIMDLFGRLGRSDASEMVAWNMPFQPNPAAWLVLLSSCAKHGHGSSIAIARRAYGCAMELR